MRLSRLLQEQPPIAHQIPMHPLLRRWVAVEQPEDEIIDFLTVLSARQQRIKLAAHQSRMLAEQIIKVVANELRPGDHILGGKHRVPHFGMSSCHALAHLPTK
jgi:hypothetical protein